MRDTRDMRAAPSTSPFRSPQSSLCRWLGNGVLAVGLIVFPALATQAQDQPAQPDQAPAPAERPQAERPEPADSPQDDQQGKSHSGEVQSAGDGKLVMTIEGKNRHTHMIQESTKVTLNGKPAKLADLRKGDRITVVAAEDDASQILRLEARRDEGSPDRDAPDAKRPAPADRPDRSPDSREPAPADRPSDRPSAPDQARDRGPRASSEGPRIGVSVAASPTTGVFVQDVQPGSPADRAGIRPGDYILTINEQKVGSPQQLSELMQSQAQNEQAMQIGIWRNEQKQTVAVNLQAARGSAFRGAGPGEQKAWLGVALDPQAEQNQQGAVVSRVFPSGPAAQAGLQQADVILRVNDQEITSAEQLTVAIERLEPGSEAQILIRRDGAERTLTAQLGDRNLAMERRPDSGFEDRGYRGGRGFDQFGNVPESELLLEHSRRVAEQNERLERLMLQLMREVRDLRQQIARGNGDARAIDPAAPRDPAPVRRDSARPLDAPADATTPPDAARPNATPQDLPETPRTPDAPRSPEAPETPERANPPE